VLHRADYHRPSPEMRQLLYFECRLRVLASCVKYCDLRLCHEFPLPWPWADGPFALWSGVHVFGQPSLCRELLPGQRRDELLKPPKYQHLLHGLRDPVHPDFRDLFAVVPMDRADWSTTRRSFRGECGVAKQTHSQGDFRAP
jgi:hypothetical protein